MKEWSVFPVGRGPGARTPPVATGGRLIGRRKRWVTCARGRSDTAQEDVLSPRDRRRILDKGQCVSIADGWAWKTARFPRRSVLEVCEMNARCTKNMRAPDRRGPVRMCTRVPHGARHDQDHRRRVADDGSGPMQVVSVDGARADALRSSMTALEAEMSAF